MNKGEEGVWWHFLRNDCKVLNCVLICPVNESPSVQFSVLRLVDKCIGEVECMALGPGGC
jgi:hypothetical protein